MENSFFRVLITGDALAQEAMEILSKKCLVQFVGSYPQPAVLAERLRKEKAHALIVRTGRAPAEVIKASTNLKVIAKHGIGVDNIDVSTATALKIPVLVTASANYQSVAAVSYTHLTLPTNREV